MPRWSPENKLRTSLFSPARYGPQPHEGLFCPIPALCVRPSSEPYLSSFLASSLRLRSWHSSSFATGSVLQLRSASCAIVRYSSFALTVVVVIVVAQLSLASCSVISSFNAKPRCGKDADASFVFKAPLNPLVNTPLNLFPCCFKVRCSNSNGRPRCCRCCCSLLPIPLSE